MSAEVSAMDVAALAGITYRQLDYWTRLGHVLTLGDPEPGHGHHRAYSPWEARVAADIGCLVRSGLRVDAAAAVARRMADAPHYPGLAVA